MKDLTYTTESVKTPSCTTCANYKQKMTDPVEASIQREEDLAELIKRRKAEIESLKKLQKETNLCENCCYEPRDSIACKAVYRKRGYVGFKIIDCDGYHARLFGWEKKVLDALSAAVGLIPKEIGLSCALRAAADTLARSNSTHVRVANMLIHIAQALE